MSSLRPTLCRGRVKYNFNEGRPRLSSCVQKKACTTAWLWLVPLLPFPSPRIQSCLGHPAGPLERALSIIPLLSASWLGKKKPVAHFGVCFRWHAGVDSPTGPSLSACVAGVKRARLLFFLRVSPIPSTATSGLAVTQSLKSIHLWKIWLFWLRFTLRQIRVLLEEPRCSSCP